MIDLNGPGWDSNSISQLNAAIAALGRPDLPSALAAYGGAASLSTALKSLGKGEYQAAYTQLAVEAAIEEEAVANGDSPATGNTNRATKELVTPDITESLTTLIGDISKWAKSAGKAARNLFEHDDGGSAGERWFVPNFAEVLEASKGAAAASGGSSSGSGSASGSGDDPLEAADVLKISKVNKAFNRDKLNEQYRDMHKEPTKSTTTGGAMVLKQQIDYIAAAERAYRLRHATTIRCLMHNSVRKEAHGHDVGVFQKTLSRIQDNLKASSPPA